MKAVINFESLLNCWLKDVQIKFNPYIWEENENE